MQIQSMFDKDINRFINGVIKVMQTDDENRQQELEEYVITRELQRHFGAFYDHYEQGLHAGTDKIGVWISGFFGSGKSHFLKILSYLLSNEQINGKKAIDYFEDKFSYDPLRFEMMKRSGSVLTETILFNVEAKSTGKTDDAILRVFAKVFYEHCGYYGDDMKIARFERFLDRQGKFDAFKHSYQRIFDEDWIEGREAFALREDAIVEALTETLGISDSVARNWFNGKETSELSIDRLACEIKEYVESKGQGFHLVFLVDEVGQYIGDNSGLMLNLQTVVEELGTKCNGRVWIIVTSQEDIDSVTKVKGNDFSKIAGRFNTRLSLSSSSVDEVIKRRILAKKSEAKPLLALVYQEFAPVLRNLFTFSRGTVADLKGYTTEQEFIDTYPFVPYQFLLMQSVLTQIRKHGSSGKHLSSGARSMLSCFQDTAKEVKSSTETALVPFYLFYDTIRSFLEGAIRSVIERADNAALAGDVIQKQDVDVLKLLFLIRYVDTVPSNLENLSTLMVSSIHSDKIAIRKDLQASLDRLVSQNYVSRNGDNYLFLTDDEQDINREIKNTLVDQNEVLKTLGEIIFSDLYPGKKVTYRDRYNIPFDQAIDDSVLGTATSDMRLRIMTLLSDLDEKNADSVLLMRSKTGEAIVLLNNEYPYYAELEENLKITKYVKQRNVSMLPETIRKIIQAKQSEAKDHEKRANDMLREAVVRGAFYVAGERLTIRGSSVKDKLDAAMARLIEDVFVKLDYVDKFCESDADISRILSSAAKQGKMINVAAANSRALLEVLQYMEIQKLKHVSLTVKDLQKRYQAAPYGWREIDIAALIASLAADLRLQILYGGNIIVPGDRKMVDYLRKRSEIEIARVKLSDVPPPDLIAAARGTVKDMFQITDVETEEAALCEQIEKLLTDARNRNQAALNLYVPGSRYPGEGVVKEGQQLFSGILGKRNDNVVFLQEFVEEKAQLLIWRKDFEPVAFFFANQKNIFHDAVDLLAKVSREKAYFADETEALAAGAVMREIISDSNPYQRIKELPTLKQTIDQAYECISRMKHERVQEVLVKARGDIHTLAADNHEVKHIVREMDEQLERYVKKAEDSTSAMELMAMITEIEDYKDKACTRIESLILPPPPDLNLRIIRRYDVFPQRTMTMETEIDAYLDDIAKKLKERLQGYDGIQLN